MYIHIGNGGYRMSLKIWVIHTNEIIFSESTLTANRTGRSEHNEEGNTVCTPDKLRRRSEAHCEKDSDP